MSEFNLFINEIENEEHREKLKHLFEWIETQYSDLKTGSEMESTNVHVQRNVYNCLQQSQTTFLNYA